MRSGWNCSIPSGFSLIADELDRDPGHGAQREGRAAPSVAVHLGQHHAGDADLLMELLGDFYGVLTGHGVGDQQHLRRVQPSADLGDLAHHRLVDDGAAGRVDDDIVEPHPVGVLDRFLGQIRRFPVRLVEDRDVELLTERLELGHGGRAVRVCRHHDRSLPLLAQQQRQLRRQRRLARALEADQQDDVRRVGGGVDPGRAAAEHLDQLVVDDLDDLLGRVEPLQDVRAERLLLDRI